MADILPFQKSIPRGMKRHFQLEWIAVIGKGKRDGARGRLAGSPWRSGGLFFLGCFLIAEICAEMFADCRLGPSVSEFALSRRVCRVFCLSAIDVFLFFR